MNTNVEAYPLCWPAGWPRTPSHRREYGRFSRKGGTHSWISSANLTVSDGVKRILEQLRLFGVIADDVIISSNIQLRRDGLPLSGRPEPSDPGVAVYWLDGGGQRCMASDRYTKATQNLAAIAATLEAMRAIERHGGAAILDRAFTGFAALPHLEQWWQVLGFESSDVTREQIIDAHKRLARQHHPDNGGDADQMARINVARDEGLERVRS